MEKSQLERASWVAGIVSAIVAIITLFLFFFGPSNNHDEPYPSEVVYSDPVEKEKPVQSIPVEYGYYCCDSKGNRRCPIPYKLPLGTPCLCEGQGEGVVCK